MTSWIEAGRTGTATTSREKSCTGVALSASPVFVTVIVTVVAPEAGTTCGSTFSLESLNTVKDRPLPKLNNELGGPSPAAYVGRVLPSTGVAGSPANG